MTIPAQTPHWAGHFLTHIHLLSLFNPAPFFPFTPLSQSLLLGTERHNSYMYFIEDKIIYCCFHSSTSKALFNALCGALQHGYEKKTWLHKQCSRMRSFLFKPKSPISACMINKVYILLSPWEISSYDVDLNRIDIVFPINESTEIPISSHVTCCFLTGTENPVAIGTLDDLECLKCISLESIA